MMNKILLSIIIVFACCSFSNAQLKKGSLWAGGDFSYGSFTNRVNDEPDLQARRKVSAVRPFVGISTTENSISGIIFQYRKMREKYVAPGGRATEEIQKGAGWFYRKYKMLGKGFYIYINGEVNYVYVTRESRSVEEFSDFNNSKEHLLILTTYPGIAYALNKNIHLEMRTGNLFNVHYSDRKQHSEWPVNNKRDDHSRHFEIYGSFNETFNYLSIGFRILLNGKERGKTSVDSGK